MRIIAGEARGRRLFAPGGVDTRPTADRVRESLFNVIAPRVPGARVLDLFAGSGALAFEALSRGASFAVINDPARGAAAAIARNARLLGYEDRIAHMRRDWKSALAALNDRFDLVFFDPPYRMAQVYGEAAQLMRERGLLAPGALIVMEHAARDVLRLPDGFCVVDERRYGDVAVALVAEEGSA